MQANIRQRTDSFSLENGDIWLKWYDDISIEELADVLVWMDLIKNKIKRQYRNQYRAGGCYFVGPIRPIT